MVASCAVSLIRGINSSPLFGITLMLFYSNVLKLMSTTVQPIDPQPTTTYSNTSIPVSITSPPILGPTSSSDLNALPQSAAASSTDNYLYDPSSTTCNFACTYDSAACSVLAMMGVCLSPTTYSTVPTSVDGYTALSINMSPSLIPGCSTTFSRVTTYSGEIYTFLKTNACYSDIYQGWTPSTRDGPQPTPENPGPNHLVPHTQSSVTGGLAAVGGPGMEGPVMIPTATPTVLSPGAPQPIKAPSSDAPQMTSPPSIPQPGAPAGGKFSPVRPVSPPAQPAPIPAPAPIMTIGSSVVTQDASSNFVIGSQTLAPGGSITHSGTVLSLAPSGGGVVFGPSTQAVQPAPSPQPLPVVTLAGSTLTANAASQFQVGTQTLVPGAPPITQGGQVISLAPSAAAIVLGPSTQQITSPAGAPPPVIVVGGSAVTQNSAGQFVVGSQTVGAGSPPITVAGQAVSIVPSGNAVVFGPTTQNLAPAAPPAPVITVAGRAITVNAQSQYIVGSQTLATNSPPITIAGQQIALAPSGNSIIFGPSTQALETPTIVIATSAPVLTIGTSLVSTDASSNYIIAGQTLRPGSAITVSGTAISLSPSATALVINGQTQSLAASKILATQLPPLITLGSTVLTADAASDYIIGGQTLIPGAHAITVSGNTYSLAPSATALVIGTSTEKLTPQLMGISTGLPVLTIGAAQITANAVSDYAIAGQTLRPGGVITVSGTRISLASDDRFLVVGTSTETLHLATRTTGVVTTSASNSSFSAAAASTTSASLSLGDLTGAVSTPTVGVAKAASTPKAAGQRVGVSFWGGALWLCGMVAGVMFV